MQEIQQEWLSLSQTAQLLGVHPSTVRTWADRGDLPVHRTAGGHRRFRRAELEIWAEARRIVRPEDAHGLLRKVIGRARLEMAEGRLNDQPWYRKVDECHRAAFREHGREMLREMMRSVAAGEEPLQADRLGRDYARMSLSAGMSLHDATAAFLFFQEFLFDSLFDLYETAGVTSPSAWNMLRSHISLFANRMLLALIESYAERCASASDGDPNDVK